MAGRLYFPLGIATKNAFCNRFEESKFMLGNIDSNVHMLVMAPRRYGKTSLCLEVIKKSKLPFVEIDFFMARNEQVVAEYLLKAISQLIGKAVESLDRMVGVIKRFAKSVQPTIHLGNQQANIELTIQGKPDPATNVLDALMLLEKLLESKNQKSVMLLDEFQMVGVIAKGSGIEAAVRHVAQKTKYLTFIFSGSNRRLLENMFESDARPLYKLAVRMNIGKISEAHYLKHINKASKITWGEKFNVSSFSKVMTLTERHPYYVNKLCNLLWGLCTKLPSAKQVADCWKLVLQEERSDVIREVGLLSPLQKDLIAKIASGVSTGLAGKEVLSELNVGSSSVADALGVLVQNDLVEKKSEGYNIINPALKNIVLK